MVTAVSGKLMAKRFLSSEKTLSLSLSLLVQWRLRSVRRQEMSTKFPLPRPPTAPCRRSPRCRPSSWRLARSSRFHPALPHRRFFFRSTIHPSDLPPAFSPCFILLLFRPFLARSSFPPVATSNFVSPDIAELLVLSRRFHRNATARERRRRTIEEDRVFSLLEGRRARSASGNMIERDGGSAPTRNCARTKFVFSGERRVLPV